MDAYSTANWTSVFSALTAAAAALTGLLFVAISINLRQVIDRPGLSGRAVEVPILLVSTLILSTLLVMPGQALGSVAAQVIAIALTAAFSMGYLQLRTPRRALGLTAFEFATRVVADQAGPVLLLLGGFTLLAQNGGGLYWVVPAMLVSLVAAIVGAWVLLVEIHR